MPYADRATEGTPGEIKHAGEAAWSSAEQTLNRERERTADALDDAAEGVDRQKDNLSGRLDDYADSVKSAMGSTADYVRHNNARQMADDAATLVSDHPVASLLILGAIVAGGGLLLAGVMGGQNESSASSGHLHARSSTVWGPKTAAVVSQFRDALFSLAVARTVQTVDEMFPGFKQHFEKA
jgi:ElaB/YqjD/DUF883 family membrane-anchored ribosome-binding protein